MIELVVLDLAGTTVHDGDAVADCFAAALASAGVHPTRAQINAVMGLHKPQAVRMLLGREDGADAVHEDFVERMIRHYDTSPDVREIAGATALFRHLRTIGKKVAVNTGFGRRITDVLLARLGWQHVIDASITSDEVAQGRPAPDMIRALMARLGIADASKVAKVGDTVSDLQEGKNAGCGLVVGVLSGAGRRDELEAEGCPLIASVADLPALLT